MLEATPQALAATAAITPLASRRITSIAAPQSGTLPPAGQRLGNLLWNGPGSWLLLDDEPAPFNARTTDQSDGLALFALSGPNAAKILKQLISIDIHPEVFTETSVAITLAAHIGVRLWREGDAFILACFRSFSTSLYHALVEAEQHSLN